MAHPYLTPGEMVEEGMAPEDTSWSAVKAVPLGEAIDRATRFMHTKVDKLVLHRLLLAIPPQADTPSLYVSGLLHLAPVYITFESLWRSLLDCPTVPDGPHTLSREIQAEIRSFGGGRLPPSEEPIVTERVHSVLGSLLFPGLQRSARLKADIRSLTRWTPLAVEGQIRAVAKTGHLSVFIRHIERTVERQPLTLLAYGWV